MTDYPASSETLEIWNEWVDNKSSVIISKKGIQRKVFYFTDAQKCVLKKTFKELIHQIALLGGYAHNLQFRKNDVYWSCQVRGIKDNFVTQCLQRKLYKIWKQNIDFLIFIGFDYGNHVIGMSDIMSHYRKIWLQLFFYHLTKVKQLSKTQSASIIVGNNKVWGPEEIVNENDINFHFKIWENGAVLHINSKSHPKLVFAWPAVGDKQTISEKLLRHKAGVFNICRKDLQHVIQLKKCLRILNNNDTFKRQLGKWRWLILDGTRLNV